VSVVYFTDRDLGLRFPEILKQAGLAVERHADHFDPDAPDEAWLEEVSERQWVAITHNSRIRYSPNEKQAVIRHRVRLLVIIGDARDSVSNRTISEQESSSLDREGVPRLARRVEEESGRLRSNRTLAVAAIS
jgi:hypothetical protein